MTVTDLTLAQLIEISRNPEFATFLDGMLVQSYDDFVEVLYSDIDSGIDLLQESAELLHNCKEDLLTQTIKIYLKGKGYTATHDEKHRGHCDLLVRKGRFKWIGEAKIHGAYDTLFKGFKQLSTRYSTGDSNQNSGGVIVYIRGKDAKLVMEAWKEHLEAQELPDFTTSTCGKRALSFFSSHTHEGSGLTFKVRHMPVLLYFNPMDK